MLVETIITDGTTQEKSTPTTLIRLSVGNVPTILAFMDISSEAKHSNRSCYANLKCFTIFRYRASHINQRNGYHIKIQQLVCQASGYAKHD